ncbi:mitochondrial 2-oxodicarboxylate carrier isoform X4 [Numida meleagris]|uniref:mitochondrial 2-oxodicarboxylate carrier isoform X4 n=1 Tax=Numida meleagris TaxID=8996 RepID=UPI000B3DA13B|nr:mitochondrial 2-oxodicarboxylate carrier isoform X4 [Numida meleagris]
MGRRAEGRVRLYPGRAAAPPQITAAPASPRLQRDGSAPLPPRAAPAPARQPVSVSRSPRGGQHGSAAWRLSAGGLSPDRRRRLGGFQIQRGKTDPTSYKSLGDCFRTIFQREGLLGFYKGVLPPILAETPKRAVKQPSSFVQAQQIIKTDGLGLHGLNKGLTATLGRHGVFNMVYFGFYFNVKNTLPVNKDPNLEFLRKFGIGLVSGTIASIINIPFDVAKSRIQGPQPVPGEIKYRTCLKTMATVYKEEGFLALYKGLIPKIMRLGPGIYTPSEMFPSSTDTADTGGAVMLLVYEYVYAWLQDTVDPK